MDKNVLSERICISDKEVQLVSFLGRKITIDGKLIVTNYSITFLTGSPIEKENILFQMPIGYIWKTERSLE